MDTSRYDRLGLVRYRTSNIQRLSAFYQDVLGFAVRRQSEREVVLGTSQRDLLALENDPGVRRVERTTGLYHTAFLVPTHRDLVHLLLRIAQTRTPVEGLNHHGTHEAVYLPDPDGNGIELAWDLPDTEWPRFSNGQFDFLRHDKVFDPEVVLAEAEADPVPWQGLPDGSRVGHVHLHMANFEDTRRFYHDLLGMDVVMAMERQGMLFLSYDGYHHHVGNNLWKGKELPPPPADATGLIEYELNITADRWGRAIANLRASGVSVEDASDSVRVKDTSGLGVVLIKVPESAELEMRS